MSNPYYTVGSLYKDSATANLYYCTGAGSKSTSTWQLIAGGAGGFADFWSSAVAYAAGSVVQVLTTTTYGGVTIVPGTYQLRQSLSVPASPTANQIPQYPYPTGGTNNGLVVYPYVYWLNISMGISIVTSCANGGSNVYVNSSGTF